VLSTNILSPSSLSCSTLFNSKLPNCTSICLGIAFGSNSIRSSIVPKYRFPFPLNACVLRKKSEPVNPSAFVKFNGVLVSKSKAMIPPHRFLPHLMVNYILLSHRKYEHVQSYFLELQCLVL